MAKVTRLYKCPACGKADEFPSVSVFQWGCSCGARFDPDDAEFLGLVEHETKPRKANPGIKGDSPNGLFGQN